MCAQPYREHGFQRRLSLIVCRLHVEASRVDDFIRHINLGFLNQVANLHTTHTTRAAHHTHHACRGHSVSQSAHIVAWALTAATYA